jgi:hypothetical protein
LHLEYCDEKNPAALLIEERFYTDCDASFFIQVGAEYSPAGSPVPGFTIVVSSYVGCSGNRGPHIREVHASLVHSLREVNGENVAASLESLSYPPESFIFGPRSWHAIIVV